MLKKQYAAQEREYDRVLAENKRLEDENRRLLDKLTAKSSSEKKDD